MRRGIVFTRQNIDTRDAEVKDCTIHTGYNTLKIAKEGGGEFSMTGSSLIYPAKTGSVDVTHNLGYKPQVFFYVYHPEIERWTLSPSRTDATNWNIAVAHEHKTDNVVTLKAEAYYNPSFFDWRYCPTVKIVHPFSSRSCIVSLMSSRFSPNPIIRPDLVLFPFSPDCFSNLRERS